MEPLRNNMFLCSRREHNVPRNRVIPKGEENVRGRVEEHHLVTVCASHIAPLALFFAFLALFSRRSDTKDCFGVHR